MLGEIANFQALASRQQSGQKRQLSGHSPDECGFARSVDAQKTDAFTGLKGEFDIRDNGRGRNRLTRGVALCITGRDAIHDEKGIGRRFGFEKVEGEFGRRPERGKCFHFFQRLETALRLPGLGGLVTETVDIRFQMGAAFGLFFDHALHERHLFGSLAFECGIIAGITFQFAIVDVEDDIGDPIEKVAVVRNDDQGSGIAFEPVFQP